MSDLHEENFDELIETMHDRFKQAVDLRLDYNGVSCYSTVHPDGMLCGVRNEHSWVEMIYSQVDMIPLEVYARSYSESVAYRWIHPDRYNARQELLGYDGQLETQMEPIEGEKWYETDSIDDILEKVRAIHSNEPFDREVVMVLDLKPEDLETLQLMAAEQNITLDKAIEGILRNLITKLDKKSFPEGFLGDSPDGVDIV